MYPWPTFEQELPQVEEVRHRLDKIFPEAVLDDQRRKWIVRDIGARTIFVMLYAFAVEDVPDRQWIRPATVTRMTDEQAAKQGKDDRLDWIRRIQRPGQGPAPGENRWYSENTRESIRDETLATLMYVGAVVEKPGVTQQSAEPRYALEFEFACLFAPHIPEAELEELVQQWHESHLTPEGRARLRRRRELEEAAREGFQVRVGNYVAQLGTGDSTAIIRGLLEDFRKLYAPDAQVMYVSGTRGRQRRVAEELAGELGIQLDRAAGEFDLLLVQVRNGITFWLIEAVATGGYIDAVRKRQLEELARQCKIDPDRVILLSAFKSRTVAIFKRAMPDIAVNTVVWCADEPERVWVTIGMEPPPSKALREFLDILLSSPTAGHNL